MSSLETTKSPQWKLRAFFLIKNRGAFQFFHARIGYFLDLKSKCSLSLSMGKYEKLLLQIIQGVSDANISFDDLCRLLKNLGFDERIRGSHHIFRKAGVIEKINLQQDGGKAKAYQVRQVRATILKYGLGRDLNV